MRQGPQPVSYMYPDPQSMPRQDYPQPGRSPSRPVIQQPERPGWNPQPEGPRWNYAALVFGCGQVLAALALTGVLIGVVVDLEGFVGDINVTGAALFMAAGIMHIVDAKHGSEFSKGVALMLSGMSFVVAIYLFSTSTFQLDESDLDTDDKPYRYQIALTAVLGVELLVVTGAIFSSLYTLCNEPYRAKYQ